MAVTPTFTIHNWMRALAERLHPSHASETNPGPIRLDPGDVWSRHTRGEALMLTCGEGQLWLTREGDARDHVLSAGDSVSLVSAGHVVVQALRPSRFCLSRRELLQPRGAWPCDPETHAP